MADIPVNANDAVITVVASTDGQTVFDFDFRVDRIEDIKGEYQPGGGLPPIALVSGVDFTVSGLTNPNGGSITLTTLTNILEGQIIVLWRDTVIDRRNNYTSDLFANEINLSEDRTIMMLQELSRDTKRAIQSPVNEQGYQIASNFTEGDTFVLQDGIIAPGPKADDIMNAQQYAHDADQSAQDAAMSAENAVQSAINSSNFASASLESAQDAAASADEAAEYISKSMIPLGYPIAFPGAPEHIDDGWDELSGQEVLRSNYPDLWALVSDGKRGALISESAWQSDPYARLAWSTGDGSTTFRFPDYNGIQSGSIQGLYMRGYGKAGVGVLQGDTIRNIEGYMPFDVFFGGTVTSGDTPFEMGSVTAGNKSSSATGPNKFQIVRFDASRVVPTADENRPVTGSIIWVARTRGATATPLTPSDAATLGANVFSGAQKALSFEGDGSLLTNVSRLGVGQTWYDVLSSRMKDTTYVNNTGKPILVNVSYAQSGTSVISADLFVDGVRVARAGQVNIPGGGLLSAIVPDGSTYQANSVINPFNTWVELR